MATLTCMRGYPGSGKSTRARELAKHTGAVVVCRDDLRMMLHGTYWTGQNEPEREVTLAEQAQVAAFLRAGKSVIVDATHLHPRYLRDWAKTARDLGADFVVYDVPTSVETCIARDVAPERLRSGKVVGEAVIRKAANRAPVDKWPDIQVKPKPTRKLVPYVANPNATPAIIVDIDGTLAHMTGRSPYDYSRVGEDTVDEVVRELVVRECKAGTIIILCSGRDSSCRQATQLWLRDNGVPWDRLLMRPEGAKDEHGNKTPDWIVKADLFDEHVRDRYNVKYVLDDRQQVVDMWRALGLKCLQVAEGQF